MNKKRIIGFTIAAFGLFLILSSQIRILGSAIRIEEIASIGSFSVGLIMLLIGILLIIASAREISEIVEEKADKQNEAEIKRINWLRKKKPIGQKPNQEARYVFREKFREEYGRDPKDLDELKGYIRGYHERGEVDDEVYSKKRRH